MKNLQRALMLEIPPGDWPLRILLAKSQVNAATMLYLMGDMEGSLREAVGGRDR